MRLPRAGRLLAGYIGSYDLGDEIDVFTMIPAPAGDGVMLQTNKATFRKIAEDSTAVVVEKDTKGMFDLRKIATNCASK